MVFVSRNIYFFSSTKPYRDVLNVHLLMNIYTYLYTLQKDSFQIGHQKKQINMHYIFLALLLYELYPSSLCILRLHKSQLVCFYPQHTLRFLLRRGAVTVC